MKTTEQTPAQPCNCLRETGERLKEKLAPGEDHFKHFSPKGATSVDSVHAENLVLAFTSGQWRLQIPYTVTWIGSKKRQTSINIIASHCPFCGTALPSLEKE